MSAFTQIDSKAVADIKASLKSFNEAARSGDSKTKAAALEAVTKTLEPDTDPEPKKIDGFEDLPTLPRVLHCVYTGGDWGVPRVYQDYDLSYESLIGRVLWYKSKVYHDLEKLKIAVRASAALCTLDIFNTGLLYDSWSLVTRDHELVFHDQGTCCDDEDVGPVDAIYHKKTECNDMKDRMERRFRMDMSLNVIIPLVYLCQFSHETDEPFRYYTGVPLSEHPDEYNGTVDCFRFYGDLSAQARNVILEFMSSEVVFRAICDPGYGPRWIQRATVILTCIERDKKQNRGDQKDGYNDNRGTQSELVKLASFITNNLYPNNYTGAVRFMMLVSICKWLVGRKDACRKLEDDLRQDPWAVFECALYDRLFEMDSDTNPRRYEQFETWKEEDSETYAVAKDMANELLCNCTDLSFYIRQVSRFVFKLEDSETHVNMVADICYAGLYQNEEQYGESTSIAVFSAAYEACKSWSVKNKDRMSRYRQRADHAANELGKRQVAVSACGNASCVKALQ